jgi:hypothetical protein
MAVRPPPLPAPPAARRWLRALLALYLLTAAFVTVQQGVFARSNNFRIFRASAVNLVAGRDLYAPHPDQHFDRFKYSPTFAVLFLPLAVLPFVPALFVWSLLNALGLYYALRRLLPERPAALAIGLVYLELLFSMQYAQSNALVTALIVLAFVALERGAQGRAAGLIAVDGFIKLFPFAAAALGLLYPRRLRFALRFAAAAAALALLPLLVTAPPQLVAQYRSWRAIETADTLNRGYSLMGYLHDWLGLDWPNWPVQLAGTAALLLPLVLRRARRAEPGFRRLFLCSLLVYCVLFNHQSERATFIIAYTGIAVWYASSAPDRLRTAVMALTLLVMAIHDVDVLPRWVKWQILVPYGIKGIPCLVAWPLMQWELLRGRRSESPGTGRSATAPAPAPT